MRLAVVNVTSGGMSGGYRKYLMRLMPLLANDPRVTDLSVFVPERAAVNLANDINVRTWQPGHAGSRFAALVRDVAARAPDVIFVPTSRHVSFGSTPVATMVRNMEPLEAPFGGNTWTEGLKNVARAWESRRACRHATRVIAVSEHVRDFIVARWRIDRERIGTVYHGVDKAVPGPATREPEAVRTLFTAGSIRPARGLEDAIRALPLLDADVQLVIAGSVDAGCAPYADRLRRLCSETGVTARVSFAGQLDTGGMASAFQHAVAFVMTSRVEACPNTALEAMSHGCAIISVDRGPMPEFFDDAARYYPATEVHTLAMQLRAVLGNAAERDRLGRAARRRAAAFTWEATRDRTIEELERARS